jgi:hypothetical protein
LETGQVAVPSGTALKPVPWARFRKAFSSNGKDLGDRTLFVVRATDLADWLAKLEFANTDAPSIEGKVWFS